MWIVTKGKIGLTGSGHDKGLEENASHAETVACWHEKSIITLLPNGESPPDQPRVTTQKTKSLRNASCVSCDINNKHIFNNH